MVIVAAVSVAYSNWMLPIAVFASSTYSTVPQNSSVLAVKSPTSTKSNGTNLIKSDVSLGHCALNTTTCT